MGRLTRFPSLFRKFAALALGAAAILLFGGFGMNGPQSTIHVEGPVAKSQLHLFYVTLWVTVFIFLTVGSALAYAQIRFRARATDDDNDPPEQTHGHPLVEVGLIIASTLLLVIIAIPTVQGIWYTYDVPEAERENALVVKVTGYQWWFKFEYPELGIVTANEMVIPTNRAVHIDLRTIDVIHSFWVPKLAGKVDLMPNRANHMWLQADRSNYYWAQCAEYCGESHANMRFRVVSLDDGEWNTWVANQQKEARTVTAAAASNAPDLPRVQFVAAQPDNENLGMAGSESPFAYWQFKQAVPAPGVEDAALIAHGRELFATKTCSGCHEVKGHNAMGITGPSLTHFASRTTLAAAMLENTPVNLRQWLDDPNAVKPGNLMWKTGGIGDPARIKLKADEITALVAYLHSLK
jgi:cytochrome c oxidase subunit II